MGPPLRFGGGVAHAPSLLRQLHSGAPRAAQNAARHGRRCLREAPAVPALGGRVFSVLRHHGGGSNADPATGERGQPRPEATSPSSAPSRLPARTRWITSAARQTAIAPRT